MKLRLAVASGLISMWLGCQAGPLGKCEQMKCGDGLECAPSTGRCVVPGSLSGTDGGVDAGVSCPMTCSAPTAVCDPATLTCVGCRVEGQVHHGCSAPTAFCDTSVTPSACVGCRTFADCQSGINMDCDPVSHTCYQFTPSTGGPVQFDDAGMTARCSSVVPSTPMCRGESCPKGYGCNSGVCVLNGRNGPVQVALRFDQPQDLDLYVVEPVRDGGVCEVFYGNPNTPPVALPFPLPFPIPMPKPCGAMMSLDRDSNRACTIDNVNVENIISPSGATPTSGVYTVRVNYYQQCQSSARVPYEVEVRANGQTRFYCGSFSPSDAKGGAEGAGLVITQFTIL